MHKTKALVLLPALLSLLFPFPFSSLATATTPPPEASVASSDALALIAFKASADARNGLQFSSKKSLGHCQWQGVACARGKVVRVVLEGLFLGGTFAPNTLTRLDQLRVLSLKNNSLSGPIPDLSGLVNLKSLFLDHNSFSGYFPSSVLSLHRVRTMDLSYNNLTGAIPAQLSALDRLYYLRLDSNGFNGSVPPFNQSSLRIFNVSGNDLSGTVPATTLLSTFPLSAFSGNPGLCGEVVDRPCRSNSPFFSSSMEPAPPEANGEQEGQLQGLLLPPPSQKKQKRPAAAIVGICAGVLLAVVFLVGVFVGIRRLMKRRAVGQMVTASSAVAGDDESVAVMSVASEGKKKEAQGLQVGKSGSLVFCAGEMQVYTLEQLMRASAEMLGRGTMGTTYKAVLDNQLIVSVKRLDASKIATVSRDTFERHMEAVGNLRHPNLVPLRAFFQAKEERLLIYDYQPNGSLFSLIHGTKSKAKPLHWTSCLKIAEDVAQGLAYIHQASRLVHGNLRSSNILLGGDFEACLTDYCLTTLVESSSSDDFDSGYRAPETRKSNRRATPRSDVFGFGVLLLELITGRPPLQQSFLLSADLVSWVRSVREEEESEESRLLMLLDIATSCIRLSPEQRPTMWQVLKMIQEVKETEMGDNELESSFYS
ncbi:hypothetical protein MRB53_012085 [Persea americana]|uniref:Uncharacterized protein n=1 Tax=Persea americana TaxID=3435 RepID=A0ACC2LX86_PERAE|nr:hypothetical protein MRB53_012085 [Persea americana]